MRILRLALIVALLVGSGHAARAEWDNIPVLNPLLLMQHPPDPVLQRLAIETGSWHPQPSTGGAGSPYPYALNNPLSNTDPTGLATNLTGETCDAEGDCHPTIMGGPSGGAPEYPYTNTVANNLPSRPFINSPLAVQEIRATGQCVPDPGSGGLPGIPGALRYDVPGYLGTPRSPGTYELVIDPNTNTIYHFKFNGD